MNPNKQMFRNLAAKAFWNYRAAKGGRDEWEKGYLYGLFTTYAYAAEHM